MRVTGRRSTQWSTRCSRTRDFTTKIGNTSARCEVTDTSMSTRPRIRPTVSRARRTNGQLDSLGFVRASLDSVQANIFMADPRFTIIFANQRALETLRGIADEIRKSFG